MTLKPYRTANRVEALPPGDVVLTGAIGELAGRLFDRRINSRYARETVYRETVDAFRNKIDDADRVIGLWQGEYWGKWVIGAARTARYTGNAELADFVRRAARELIALRDEDGCISTYRDPAFFSAAPEADVLRALGRRCDWNWNIWCRKYTLWGLLEAADLSGDAEILDAAEKFALQLLDTLAAGDIDIRHTGTFKGLASCSILKPMLMLYRRTGNRRIFDFAASIIAGWERNDGEIPNLLVNAVSGKPVHEWYPDAGNWTKAYEMLSCFDGILEFYRLTGYAPALAAAEGLYRLLTEHEANRPGSVGYNDQFQHAAIYLGSATEPCDAIHWMRFCFELYELTGEERYMTSFEETFLNAFLASILRDGSWGMRTLRSSGCHQVAPGQAGMKYNHCCVDNLPRGLLNAAESCLMTAGETLILNQFIPFSARTATAAGNRIVMTVAGEYLTRGRVAAAVECSRALTLKLRIPTWSAETVVETDGRRETVPPGYATIELAAGRHELNLAFDFTPRLTQFPFPGEPEKLPEWHRRRYFNGQTDIGLRPESGYRALLSAGPLKLARSKLIGNAAEEFLGKPKCDGNWCCRLSPVPIDGVLAGFDAEFSHPSGEIFRTRVCDFASAGNVAGCDPELFSMFF